jgi:hypothetical protein
MGIDVSEKHTASTTKTSVLKMETEHCIQEVLGSNLCWDTDYPE